MKLFWCPRTRAFRAAWLLEEMGVDYDLVRIDIHDEASRSEPEFRSASPMGKVPALTDGETRIWDSGAICLYLADAYPDAGLGVPMGDAQRGAYLMWTLYTNSVIEPAMGEKFSGREPDAVRSGFGSYDLMIETLANGLGDGPWILGDRFTAADVLLGSSVEFMEQFSMLPDRESLRAYAERCRARPAFQAARALDGDGPG